MSDYTYPDASGNEVLIAKEYALRWALDLLLSAGWGDRNNPLRASDAIADLNGIIAELEVLDHEQKAA